MKISDAKKLNAGTKIKYTCPTNSNCVKHGTVVAKDSDYLYVRWQDESPSIVYKNGHAAFVPSGVIHLNGLSVMLPHTEIEK